MFSPGFNPEGHLEISLLWPRHLQTTQNIMLPIIPYCNVDIIPINTHTHNSTFYLSAFSCLAQLLGAPIPPRSWCILEWRHLTTLCMDIWLYFVDLYKYNVHCSVLHCDVDYPANKTELCGFHDKKKRRRKNNKTFASVWGLLIFFLKYEDKTMFPGTTWPQRFVSEQLQNYDHDIVSKWLQEITRRHIL